jgi:DNA-binding XRE family transcriptional regulator
MKLLRVTAGKDMREQGAEIGVSSATICRIEQGKTCDMRSFAKIIAWLVSAEQ